MRPFLRLAVLALGAVPALQACGACGCTLHTDWAAQGMARGAGFRLDLRYDYFNQDDLREGTRSLERSTFELPNDREVQEKTLNRILTLGLDYSSGGPWGVSVSVPLVNRYHATLAPGDEDPSFSRRQGLGDIRVLGRYQGFLGSRAFGVQAGLKLPTGGSRQAFNGGPRAGEPLDAGLQLGTGTTDLLLGCFGFGRLGGSWEAFGQVLFQKPLSEARGFKPGDGLNANAGARYTGFGALTPHLQVNLRAEGRESGENADRENSGATLVYLSPGATFQVARGFQVYAFVQIPVAQRVTGLQVEPRSSLSLGVHWTF